MIFSDPKHKHQNRHNMLKFKVLLCIATSPGLYTPADSINIARRCRHSITAIDKQLKHLWEYHYIIKKIATTGNGCSFKYKLSKKGRDTLQNLLPRVKNGQDLNLKHFRSHVKYNSADIEFIQREIPPAQQSAPAPMRKVILPLSIKGRDKIFLINRGEYTLIQDSLITDSAGSMLFNSSTPQQSTPQNPQACICRAEIGDYFEILRNTYIIYYQETMTLLDYAKLFYPYEGARTSQVFLDRLIKAHKIINAQSATVQTIYFIKQNVV